MRRTRRVGQKIGDMGPGRGHSLKTPTLCILLSSYYRYRYAGIVLVYERSNVRRYPYGKFFVHYSSFVVHHSSSLYFCFWLLTPSSHHSPRIKFTTTSVSTSTGSPFKSVG